MYDYWQDQPDNNKKSDSNLNLLEVSTKDLESEDDKEYGIT